MMVRARRRHLGTVAALACSLLASCAQHGGAIGASTRPGTTEAGRSTAEASDDASSDGGPADAVWQLPTDTVVSPSTRTLPVEVSRIECSGGHTGRVLEPLVEETATEVVITFTVEPLVWPAGVDSVTCVGNEWVPSTVQLSEPLGQRELYDGECLPAATATAPGLCGRGGLRYRPDRSHPGGPGAPATAVTLTVGHCFVEPVRIAGRAWVTRRTYVGYGGGLPRHFTPDGTFHLLSRDEARFVSAGGARLRFEPDDRDQLHTCR